MGEAAQHRPLLGSRVKILALGFALVMLAGGCKCLKEWWHNGLKVGPNYEHPDVPVADAWTVDSESVVVLCDPEWQCEWWEVFNDPVLTELIDKAYLNNLDLGKAAARIYEARSERNKTRGNLLPQSQKGIAGYLHGQLSDNLTQGAFESIFDIWAVGPYVTWELDVWGRLRRGLESANANLDASIENYNDVLVMLLGEVASNYIQLRAHQQRLVYLNEDLKIQKATLKIAQDRFKQGFSTQLDVEQAKANMAQTASQIPPVQTALQQANNRLCVLLGEPVYELTECLGSGPIPAAPAEVMVGIPAETLRRRPDVRRAERQVAAQCAQIGVAKADLFPSLNVLGFLGYTATSFNALFNEDSLTGIIVPGVSWQILNYGRIMNNIKVQDARLQQQVLGYQSVVLRAGEEVENALVAFVNSQKQLRYTHESVQANEKAVKLSLLQYKLGKVDFDRVLSAQLLLARDREKLASNRQDLALNLVRVYKSLGGGWESFGCPEAPVPCETPSSPETEIAPDAPDPSDS